MTGPALTFAVVLPALLVAHLMADHWVQTHHQAVTKGQSGWVGRWACARHVGSYTAVTAVTVAVLWWVFALPISPLGFAAGQVVSAVTHYWADRRFTLQRLCDRLGKGGFYRLGQPRDVRAVTRRALVSWGVTATTAGPVVTVELVDTDGVPARWDNPSLGTGAYALDQSWHWWWLGVAAVVTAVV